MSAFDYLPDASAAVICAPPKTPAYSAHQVATGKRQKIALHPVLRGGIGGGAQTPSYEMTAPVTWWYAPTSYRQTAARGLGGGWAPVSELLTSLLKGR